MRCGWLPKIRRLSPKIGRPSATLHGMADIEPLWSPDDVAELLGVTTKTLERWRRTGRGPQSIPLNDVEGGGRGRRIVRYRRSDVMAWLDERAESAGAA